MTHSRRVFFAAWVLSGLSFIAGPGSAAEPLSADPAMLREATKGLEEEIKLAASPQVYLLVDLPEHTIVFKGRGVELYRLPIAASRVCGARPWAGAYRLHGRPPVERPQSVSADDPSLDPIELHDMPAEYALEFTPNLIVTVAPPPSEHPWLWVKSHLREWWNLFLSWVRRRVGAEEESKSTRIRLTLSHETAQSLAWSVTDDMPLLIRSAFDRRERRSANE